MNIDADLFKKLSFFTEPEFKEELLKHGQLASFNKGDVIVRDGQYVKFLPIVLKGAIRVYQQKEDREILLYYVRAEETCTMSLAAAYFNNQSSSHGIVTEPAEVLIFPASLIDQWQLKYPSWNRYVMNMFRRRYDELINSFEGIVFDPISVRVLEYLQNKAAKENSSTIEISHQQLASELGTTRVVISRILKDHEKQQKIKLYRSRIELL
ncbi:Crp/Fnr family transcriptional regulator [Mucilaginibacter sp. HMF5004]|uniref:Crp/Fnr family transcriptional regulator n=1 Tax=Mucilaginibacter rivuli TaxID=2857527 RepID=UPI001C5F6586|nr:Crp/Fnr family transcriptional regulator [Mucilaginibacter rivuli]MBW4889185.1 Crp/Fnr family transcriptional regulator [Mucilaginibacter rivuli]